MPHLLAGHLQTEAQPIRPAESTSPGRQTHSFDLTNSDMDNQLQFGNLIFYKPVAQKNSGISKIITHLRHQNEFFSC